MEFSWEEQKSEISQGKARIISVFSISTVCFCPWFDFTRCRNSSGKRPFTISAFCLLSAFCFPLSAFFFPLSAFPLHPPSGLVISHAQVLMHDLGKVGQIF